MTSQYARLTILTILIQYPDFIPSLNLPLSKALNRTGLKVLDLGSGGGLLSMMAARAGAESVTVPEQVTLTLILTLIGGAESVTGVEATPILAEMARAAVNRNGYEDKIKIHAKWSLDLTVGPESDMEEKADVVISEVVNSALIGEGMLKTYNDALDRLVKPGAIMIPAAGAIDAYVIESPEIERHTRMDTAAGTCIMYHSVTLVNIIILNYGGGMTKYLCCCCCVLGFDMRDFNLFHPADYMQYDLRHTDYRPLTDKFRPLVFDFTGKHKATSRTATLTFTRSGRAVAVAYWFLLQLDEDIQLSLSPELGGRPSPHWRQAVQYLGGIADVKAGDVMRLAVEHDMQNIHFTVLEITRG